jgi:flagellar biosynthesis protein FlhF
MQLQTFKAPTMAEALKQVKASMGSDAIILHTRTFQVRSWMGLRRREVVEITAGKGMNIGDRPGRGAGNGGGARGRDPGPVARATGRAGPGADRPALKLAGAGTYTPAAVARPPAGAPGPRPVSSEPGRQLLDTPAATSAAVIGLSQEISQLKAMVKDLVSATRRQRIPEVPEDLFDYYLQLIQNEVAEEIATDIVKTLQKQVRPEKFNEIPYVNDKIAEQIERFIPTAGPIHRTKKDGPHVVALIGPTGVGKTTTIAKLAANLKLREKKQVGLITLDTYRIAAVDQLKRYADIIGAPLRVVAGSDDLRDALASMSDLEYVLIDTAGRSPNDTLKLNELRSVLEAAHPDEVHLVLSTTASQECVELAVNRFGEVRVDRIIFTKVDEAAHLGMVLNVVRKVNKGLSYITTGQDVPDDIEVGRGKRLAQLILGKAS